MSRRAGKIPDTANELGANNEPGRQQGAQKARMSKESARCHGGNESERQ